MFPKAFPLPFPRLIALLAIALLLSQVPLGVAAQDIKDAESTAEATADADGLAGDSAWISPQFGTEVEWDDEWFAPVGMTGSDPAAGQDTLHLLWEDYRTTVDIEVLEGGRGNPSDDVAYWTSAGYLEGDFFGQVDEVEVLLQEDGSAGSDGAALIGVAGAGDPLAHVRYLQSIATGDDTTVILRLDAPLDAWMESLAAAQEAIAIDGESSFDVFDPSGIESALEDAPTATYSEEDAGLVENGDWVGPAYGYELSWPESWALNHRVRYPVVSSAIEQADEVHIAGSDPEVEPAPYFDFYAYPARESTMQEELDIFVDPDWVSLGFPQEVEITALLQETSDDAAEALVAVTFAETGEVEYIWFRFARVGDDNDLYFYFKARDEDFADAWETMTGDFALNGDAIDTILTWDDIEPAIADFEG